MCSLLKPSFVSRYRGHRVLQTLVRAYFSPVESTGQRYIYTGSTDGTVYIYDVVSGETVRKLSGHFATVRDVAWHPTLPLIATSSVRFFPGLKRAFCWHLAVLLRQKETASVSGGFRCNLHLWVTAAFGLKRTPGRCKGLTHITEIWWLLWCSVLEAASISCCKVSLIS